QSAEEFANDIERFLDGLPILSRPITWIKQLKKWILLNKAVAMAVPIFILLFLWSALLIYKNIQHSKEELKQAANTFLQRVRDRSDIADKYLIRFQTATRTQAALAKFFLTQKILTKEPPLMASDFELDSLAPKDYAVSSDYQRKVSFLEPAFRLAPGVDPEKYQSLIQYLANIKFNFQTLHQSNLEFTWAYIALREGILLLYPGTDISLNFDPRLRLWYEQASKTEETVWIFPYEDAENQGMTLTCAVAIRDDQKNLLGVSGLDLTEITFKQQLLSFELPFPSTRAIYHPDGKCLLLKKDYSLPDINPLPLPSKGSSLLRFASYPQGSYVISYSWLDTLECFLVVVAQESDILIEQSF
ncbi:MAG: cache domain-containing protein, partial [Planctomycetota bacterium]